MSIKAELVTDYDDF